MHSNPALWGAGWGAMAGRTQWNVHDVEETEKVVPLFTGEIALCEDVGKFVLGVNICDLNLSIQVDSVKWPIKRNSVGTGHVCHCRTPAFDYHLNSGLTVLGHVQHGIGRRNFRIPRHIVNVKHIRTVVHVGALVWFLVRLLDVVRCNKSPCAYESLVLLDGFGEWWNTSITKFQRSRAGITSMREPASVGIWFRMLSVVLCNKFPCNSAKSLVLLVWCGEKWHTSITKSQRPRAGIPSIRRPAYNGSLRSLRSLNCASKDRNNQIP